MLLSLASLWSIPDSADLAGSAVAQFHSAGTLKAPASLRGDAGAAMTTQGALLARARLAGSASAGATAGPADLVTMQFLIRCGGVFLTPAGRVLPAGAGLALGAGGLQSVDLGPVSVSQSGTLLVNA